MRKLDSEASSPAGFGRDVFARPSRLRHLLPLTG